MYAPQSTLPYLALPYLTLPTSNPLTLPPFPPNSQFFEYPCLALPCKPGSKAKQAKERPDTLVLGSFCRIHIPKTVLLLLLLLLNVEIPYLTLPSPPLPSLSQPLPIGMVCPYRPLPRSLFDKEERERERDS